MGTAASSPARSGAVTLTEELVSSRLALLDHESLRHRHDDGRHSLVPDTLLALDDLERLLLTATASSPCWQILLKTKLDQWLVRFVLEGHRRHRRYHDAAAAASGADLDASSTPSPCAAANDEDAAGIPEQPHAPSSDISASSFSTTPPSSAATGVRVPSPHTTPRQAMLHLPPPIPREPPVPPVLALTLDEASRLLPLMSPPPSPPRGSGPANHDALPLDQAPPPPLPPQDAPRTHSLPSPLDHRAVESIHGLLEAKPLSCSAREDFSSTRSFTLIHQRAATLLALLISNTGATLHVRSARTCLRRANCPHTFTCLLANVGTSMASSSEREAYLMSLVALLGIETALEPELQFAALNLWIALLQLDQLQLQQQQQQEQSSYLTTESDFRLLFDTDRASGEEDSQGAAHVAATAAGLPSSMSAFVQRTMEALLELLRAAIATQSLALIDKTLQVLQLMCLGGTMPLRLCR